MVRFLIRLVLAFGLVAGLSWAWGRSMPREHVVASRIVLADPIEQVFAVIRNPAALVNTWSELSSAERVSGQGGREVWEERVDGFDLRLIVTEVRPPTRMVTTIDADEDAAFGGRWTYDLARVDGGTQVTITEAGWIANPLYRVMGRVFGHHRSIEGYLRALGQHFTQGVRPERLPT